MCFNLKKKLLRFDLSLVQAHMTNTGVDNPGNINVKNVYNDSYYGTRKFLTITSPENCDGY